MNIGDKVKYKDTFNEQRRGVIVDISSSLHDTVKLQDGIPYYISKKMSATAGQHVYMPVKQKNLSSVFISVIINSTGKTEFLLLDEVTAFE